MNERDRANAELEILSAHLINSRAQARLLRAEVRDLLADTQRIADLLDKMGD